MKLSNKELEQIGGAIITSFVNLHFLEEAQTGGLFKQRVKNNVKRTLNDLINIEDEYFSKVENIDDNELGDKLVANKLEFVRWLLQKFTFNDFSKIQEVCVAYSLDKEKLSEVSDAILLENGSIEIK
jgi:hypothetical protein|uniref:Uncharacterized protein n=1 Tax=uncultured marine virus TaxID=186617 RepID=A0A0F7L766_9VIRU|nr:hypothetical protein [uncultured marine virus]